MKCCLLQEVLLDFQPPYLKLQDLVRAFFEGGRGCWELYISRTEFTVGCPVSSERPAGI